MSPDDSIHSGGMQLGLQAQKTALQMSTLVTLLAWWCSSITRMVICLIARVAATVYSQQVSVEGIAPLDVHSLAIRVTACVDGRRLVRPSQQTVCRPSSLCATNHPTSGSPLNSSYISQTPPPSTHLCSWLRRRIPPPLGTNEKWPFASLPPISLAESSVLIWHWCLILSFVIYRHEH